MVVRESEIFGQLEVYVSVTTLNNYFGLGGHCRAYIVKIICNINKQLEGDSFITES